MGKSNLKYKLDAYSQRENWDLRSGQIWVKNPARYPHGDIGCMCLEFRDAFCLDIQILLFSAHMWCKSHVTKMDN